MKQKSLVKNTIFNFIYTSLNLFFPLITAPYISRVLGATNLGKVNFANNIALWFVIIANFGISTYGVREIAKHRDSPKTLNKIFSEIFIIDLIMTIVSTAIFLVIIFNFSELDQERNLYLIVSINVLLNFFALDWFFQGIEEYGYITLRSAIFRVISLVCIFIFIQSPDDYKIYAFISVFSNSASGIMNFLYSRKFVTISLSNISLRNHFASLKIFFVTTFIVNIYTHLDQTLLGILSTSASVAFMTRSKMITSAASSLANAITNATMSRASYYFNSDTDSFESLKVLVPKFIIWLGVPISLGIYLLAEDIMFLLGGKEFLPATIVLKMITPIIILAPLSGYLHRQILIPYGFEKEGMYISFVTSSVSLILNFSLIRFYGVLGAGFAVLFSEFSAFFMRLIIIKYKKKIDFNILNKETILYIISGVVMFISVNSFKNQVSLNYYFEIIFSIIMGIIIYFGILLTLKEKVTIRMVLLLKKIKLFS